LINFQICFCISGYPWFRANKKKKNNC